MLIFVSQSISLTSGSFFFSKTNLITQVNHVQLSLHFIDCDSCRVHSNGTYCFILLIMTLTKNQLQRNVETARIKKNTFLSPPSLFLSLWLFCFVFNHYNYIFNNRNVRNNMAEQVVYFFVQCSRKIQLFYYHHTRHYHNHHPYSD